MKAPDNRVFEVHCEPMDVTSLRRPDETWEFTDPPGHRHRWEWPDGRRVYQPQERASLPTLKYVIDRVEFDSEGEPYNVGHYECVACGAHVEPRMTADTTTVYIPGLRTYLIDGRSVSPEVFREEFEKSTGQKLPVDS